jgi:hypothetical protein
MGKNPSYAWYDSTITPVRVILQVQAARYVPVVKNTGDTETLGHDFRSVGLSSEAEPNIISILQYIKQTTETSVT